MTIFDKSFMLNILNTRKGIIKDSLFYPVKADYTIRELWFGYEGRRYYTTYKIGGKETPWKDTKKVVCFEKVY